MATQIAPTPAIKGKQALAILDLAKKQPTAKTKAAIQKMVEYFENQILDR